MRVGSLFSGIGGLDLALEAFGHEVIWQAESDPYARAVLAKHWPGVRCFNDVREIDERAKRPDIICGGFPCQDISNAGKRVGIDGEKSGLWSEFARIIRVLRPRFVFVENVAALTVRGLDRVLGDLASLGFDAEWDVLRAADVGAPHLRARIFILAYAQRADLREQQGRLGGAGGPGEAQPGEHGESWTLAHAFGQPGDARGTGDADEGEGGRDAEGGLEDARGNIADRRDSASAARLSQSPSESAAAANTVADTNGAERGPASRDAVAGRGTAQARQGEAEPGGRHRGAGHPGWELEPDMGRVAPRFPVGVDGRGTGIGRGSGGIAGGRDRANRLRCLGNAVVWQQAAFALETLTARARRASAERAA